MEVLEDLSPFPFGRHKGKPMQDVPADYLFWLWADRGMKREVKTSSVADYISRNLTALKMELPDRIW